MKGSTSLRTFKSRAESNISPELIHMLEEDRFRESKLIHKVFLFFALLYMGFGVADYLYAPDRFWEFLALRAAYCIVPVGIYFAVDRTKSFRQTEYLAALHATVASAIITYMIYSTSGVSSQYYAGLNLIGIIALCFFTFSWKFYWITAALIYSPYYFMAFWTGSHLGQPEALVLNSFFIAGTNMVSALIHYFREYYRFESVNGQFQLQQELVNRNEIIEKKTEEAVALSALSSQFSPQVVESIRNGKIKIDSGGQRAQICAIFIDIVNSTERVTRIDKDKVEKVLSKFLDDSIKILLKYDITIDKFLGDGILAFCNAPLKRTDYVVRVINAALEIREQIKMEHEFFERNWQKQLEIRVGIAKGYANVGFYGSKKYYRSYTAIGPALNLASRLCSSAEPSQILIDYDVFEEAQNHFETEFLGKRLLKGFEQDIVHVYEVKESRSIVHMEPGVNECPACGSILSLETNAQGQFVFMCKTCCSVVENATPLKNAA